MVDRRMKKEQLYSQQLVVNDRQPFVEAPKRLSQKHSNCGQTKTQKVENNFRIMSEDAYVKLIVDRETNKFSIFDKYALAIKPDLLADFKRSLQEIEDEKQEEEASVEEASERPDVEVEGEDLEQMDNHSEVSSGHKVDYYTAAVQLRKGKKICSYFDRLIIK